MSKARPLKKRLAALEADAAQCTDPAEREQLIQKAIKLRSDLEQAGYLSPLTKQEKPKKRKRRAKSNKPQNVDPLVRAMSRPGFGGRTIKFVQGGATRGK